jgi:hypothetical protein
VHNSNDTTTATVVQCSVVSSIAFSSAQGSVLHLNKRSRMQSALQRHYTGVLVCAQPKTSAVELCSCYTTCTYNVYSTYVMTYSYSSFALYIRCCSVSALPMEHTIV